MAADSHHLVDGLGYLIHAIGVIATRKGAAP
jgi:hypothetical protein